jgi:hypothetical protein
MPLQQAFGGDDSDVGSLTSNHAKAENSNLNAVPDNHLSEDKSKQRKGNENSVDEMDPPIVLPSTESYRSMGEILSSMDSGNHLPVIETQSGSGKQTGKASSGTSFSAKRSSFWGRSNVSLLLFDHLLSMRLLCAIDNTLAMSWQLNYADFA